MDFGANLHCQLTKTVKLVLLQYIPHSASLDEPALLITC